LPLFSSGVFVFKADLDFAGSLDRVDRPAVADRLLLGPQAILYTPYREFCRVKKNIEERHIMFCFFWKKSTVPRRRNKQQRCLVEEILCFKNEYVAEDG
jgi:hypothetical protein